jgi:hypothetical protein
MAKEFNITGRCLVNEHYMADVSAKITQTVQLAEQGKYFIINRPRQYGKTTTLFAIGQALQNKGGYVVFNGSFEGTGDEMFKNEKKFVQGFWSILSRYVRYNDKEMEKSLQKHLSKVTTLDELSDKISDLVFEIDKKIVLIIDKVDQSSNFDIFIKFLAMLRNKYLIRDKVPTFHAVILAGVHDVKSLKLKMRPNEEQKYNSPWNIASPYKVDMNLYPSEIKPMLDEYVQDKGVKMDTQFMADRLFYYTSGYPFLVSRLCKFIDEDILPDKSEKEWTDEDLTKAFKLLMYESNTNFESLIKNVENNKDLYDLVYKVAIDNEEVTFDTINPTINWGVLYGVFVNKEGKVAIHNRIYRERLLNYMAVRLEISQSIKRVDMGYGYRNDDNTLNMPQILIGFQNFMKKEYNKKDRDFLEKNGRLVFLAFLKPIINGGGYDFKEPQVSDEKRLDIAVTYFENKYVFELKLWRGEAAHEKGLKQLADYLETQGVEEGYLLIFDHSTVKNWQNGWTEKNGKKIFMAWV